MPEQEKSGRDLEQRRAAFAWDCAIHNLNSDYANLAKSAPALIMNNGLMQTLAFYESKRKSQVLSGNVCKWLATEGFTEGPRKNSFHDVMDALHQSASVNYRRATEEALALLRWIRQFASALSKSEV